MYLRITWNHSIIPLINQHVCWWHCRQGYIVRALDFETALRIIVVDNGLVQIRGCSKLRPTCDAIHNSSLKFIPSIFIESFLNRRESILQNVEPIIFALRLVFEIFQKNENENNWAAHTNNLLHQMHELSAYLQIISLFITSPLVFESTPYPDSKASLHHLWAVAVGNENRPHELVGARGATDQTIPLSSIQQWKGKQSQIVQCAWNCWH